MALITTGPIYAITGANGHIGSALARALIADGKRVRALGRDQKKLATLGAAERVFGSLDDAMYLTKAFAGTAAVFLMIPPFYASGDYLGYGRRTTEAMMTALAASPATHIVALSSVGAELAAGSGLIRALHGLEERLQTLGRNLLVLRPVYFLENHLASIPVIKGMGAFGSALNPDLAQGMIATADIAAYAAKRLSALDFNGTVVQSLQGAKDYTLRQVAATLGKEIGKPDLPCVQFPYADAQKAMIGMGFSPNVAELFMEMVKGLNDGVIKPTVPRSAETTTPTTLGQFAKSFAAAFRASGP